MKQLITIMFIGLISITGYAQDKMAKIEFKDTTIDYGTVEKGADGVRVFEFTNTGDAPLIISKVKSTCGCTVPNYPKVPIAPGASSYIDVTFDSKGRTGKQSKAVTLTANTNPNRKVIRINSEVITE